MYYHVWFITKYRKKVLEGKINRKIRKYFLEVARNKNYSILEIETELDHVHMLIEADDKKKLADTIRVLKAVSAKKILEETPGLYLGNVGGHFWAPRYGYREISEKEIEQIRCYIRNQKTKRYPAR